MDIKNLLKKHSELLNFVCPFTVAFITSIMVIWGEDCSDTARKIFVYLSILCGIILYVWLFFIPTPRGKSGKITGPHTFKFMVCKNIHMILDYFCGLIYLVVALTWATYALINFRYINISVPLRYILIFGWGIYAANSLIRYATIYLQKVAAQKIDNDTPNDVKRRSNFKIEKS